MPSNGSRSASPGAFKISLASKCHGTCSRNHFQFHAERDAMTMMTKTSCRGAHKAGASEADAHKAPACKTSPCAAKWIVAIVLLPTSLLAESVSLKRVVELALTHATGAAITAADEAHAAAGYQELHNNYIPQISTGAGL